MKNSLLVAKHTLRLASANGGAVRPVDVEKLFATEPPLDTIKISRYAVREMFREMKTDGLLHLRGNYYVVNCNHWVFYTYELDCS